MSFPSGNSSEPYDNRKCNLRKRQQAISARASEHSRCPRRRAIRYPIHALAALGRRQPRSWSKERPRACTGCTRLSRRRPDGRPHRPQQSSTPQAVGARLDGEIPGDGCGIRQAASEDDVHRRGACGVRAEGVTSFELMQQASAGPTSRSSRHRLRRAARGQAANEVRRRRDEPLIRC